MKEEIIICACGSPEHQGIFWSIKDVAPDCDIIYVEFHLAKRPFFTRIWYAIRYVFGYTSKFGAWDEFIFNKLELEKLKNFLDSTKNPVDV